MNFGLKTLLLFTGFVVVGSYLLSSAPNDVATAGLIVVLVAQTALVVAGLAYGTAGVRAFCIGAIIPTGATAIALTWLLCVWLFAARYSVRHPSDIMDYLDKSAFTFRIWSPACWLLATMVGGLTVAVRRALQRPASRNDSAAG